MSFDPDAPARSDSLFGLPFTDADARVVLLPVPWQATTSYRRGTRNGPAATLAASAQVDLYDLDVGDAWRHGYALLPADAEVRAWDEEAEPDALAVIESGGQDAEAASSPRVPRARRRPRCPPRMPSRWFGRPSGSRRTCSSPKEGSP